MEWEWRRIAAEEIQVSTEWVFCAYEQPLTSVYLFKCIVQVLTALDEYWPTVVRNLRKARTDWARLLMILVWERANTRVLGIFLNEVVQAVLLFGLEMWVINPLMSRFLGGVTAEGGP